MTRCSSLALLIAATSSLAATPTGPCPTGKMKNADTAGHCCWPGQAWASMKGACVGAPTCPPKLKAQAEECVADCPEGQVVNADTDGNCCWPGQAWSSARKQCVGRPDCPAGLQADAETCVASAAPARRTPLGMMPQRAEPSTPEPPPPPPPVQPSRRAPLGHVPQSSEGEPLPPARSEPPRRTPSYLPNEVIEKELEAERQINQRPDPDEPPRPLGSPKTVMKRRTGLAVTGLVLFGVGWLGSIAVSVHSLTNGITTSGEPLCWSGLSYRFVPFLGPLVSTLGSLGNSACSSSSRLTISLLGALELALQLTGALLAVLGFTTKVEVPVEDARAFQPVRSVRLAIGTSGTPLGLTLVLTD